MEWMWMLDRLSGWRVTDDEAGFDRVPARNLTAETGVDTSRFPSERRLSSWAGFCPGINEKRRETPGHKVTLEQLAA